MKYPKLFAPLIAAFSIFTLSLTSCTNTDYDPFDNVTESARDVLGYYTSTITTPGHFYNDSIEVAMGQMIEIKNFPIIDIVEAVSPEKYRDLLVAYANKRPSLISAIPYTATTMNPDPAIKISISSTSWRLQVPVINENGEPVVEDGNRKAIIFEMEVRSNGESSYSYATQQISLAFKLTDFKVDGQPVKSDDITFAVSGRKKIFPGM